MMEDYCISKLQEYVKLLEKKLSQSMNLSEYLYKELKKTEEELSFYESCHGQTKLNNKETI